MKIKLVFVPARSSNNNNEPKRTTFSSSNRKFVPSAAAASLYVALFTIKVGVRKFISRNEE
jgi:hypothetical protein